MIELDLNMFENSIEMGKILYGFENHSPMDR